jgi:hypothetical protein
MALEASAKYGSKLDGDFKYWIVPAVRQAQRSVAVAKRRLMPAPQTSHYLAQMPARYDRAISFVPHDPRSSAARRLVDYFRATASSTLNDAHARVATIGNARWGWAYRITKNAFGNPECPGLRKLLDRQASRATQSRPRSQRTPALKRR